MKRVKLLLSSFFICMFILSSISMATTFGMTPQDSSITRDGRTDSIGPDLYSPIDEVPLNIKEEMTLSPMFTPDNALDIHAAWLRKANTSIVVQNQYIRKFGDGSWDNDQNPIVRELVKAAEERSVSVRVQVRGESDDDLVASYLNGITNIEARYMGDSFTAGNEDWLSYTHNKLVIIDSKVTLISSINFGENAFMNNREAGMVVQSTSVSNYFLKFFDADWAVGDTDVQVASPASQTENNVSFGNQPMQGESFTDIPRINFTGNYNVSAYVNPDNADEHIFNYLATAKESIYVSMYTISKEEFVDMLVELKQNNPALDIQVLISRRRVGGSENVDTQASALRLVENLIPVYNSTDQLNFYHNKYWIIDQKHTFVYSGNWSPKSVTSPETDNTWSSTDPNRDMGIAVHNAPDIANFFKEEVWDLDVAAGVAYDLPIGISQTSFEQTEVVSGDITLAATVTKLTNPSVSYSFGSVSKNDLTLTNNAFSETFDTTTLENGITTFKVTAVDENGATYTDEVTVNIANYPDSDNFRLLITEVHPNPVGTDSEGEFIEITNSFPFELLIEDWQVGDDDALYTFGTGYTISAYTSIIIARDATGFQSLFGTTAEIELTFTLANSDGTVLLLNRGGDYVDVVAYGADLAPDGSESITADFEEGMSIARSPLYYDTNTASDFVLENPSPKADVPQVALGEEPAGLEDLPFPWVGIFVLVIIPIVRRKRYV